ncbi:hypothetical protein MNBD_GAMMA09-1985 [hydrothermal vent metagenome]|uniref:DUF3592 domain-containing protein n=1 Tax=hydrothermal vent metagenome TaxID=652676 RepID=A0A3B0XWC8_9ZZZZ
MTTHETLRRAFRLLIIASILTTGGAVLYENEYVNSGIRTSGEIMAFKRKAYSSAQGDAIEMEIRYTVNKEQKIFYSSRNVIEQIMATYKPGDTVPVVYNPDRYPEAKIGNLQHLYQITLIFIILWLVFCIGLIIAWRRNLAENDN